MRPGTSAVVQANSACISLLTQSPSATFARLWGAISAAYAPVSLSRGAGYLESQSGGDRSRMLRFGAQF